MQHSNNSLTLPSSAHIGVIGRVLEINTTIIS